MARLARSLLRRTALAWPGDALGRAGVPGYATIPASTWAFFKNVIARSPGVVSITSDLSPKFSLPRADSRPRSR